MRKCCKDIFTRDDWTWYIYIYTEMGLLDTMEIKFDGIAIGFFSDKEKNVVEQEDLVINQRIGILFNE